MIFISFSKIHSQNYPYRSASYVFPSSKSKSSFHSKVSTNPAQSELSEVSINLPTPIVETKKQVGLESEKAGFKF